MTNRINLENGFMSLDILIFEENDVYIAYMPALNLTSHSKDQKAAVKGLNTAVTLFFDHWTKKGQLTEKLSKLGWEREETTKHLKPATKNMNVPYDFIDGSFEDVIKVSVTPKQEPKEAPKKKAKK